MDGEPIEDELDSTIPVDDDEVDALRRDEEGANDDEALVDGSYEEASFSAVYDEPREGGGPDLTDESQDEVPSPPTRSG